MKITWIRCATYDEARNYSRVIYLHEWNEKPFYWGKCKDSFFGGGKRKYDGLHASGRYNVGYRHWIEGCLRHGAKLYVGELDGEASARIDEVENFLIHRFQSDMNTRFTVPSKQMQLVHEGEVPAVLRRM